MTMIWFDHWPSLDHSNELLIITQTHTDCDKVQNIKWLSIMDHHVIFLLSQCSMGEKIRGINLQSHFSNWSKFGNLGPNNCLKYSRAILKHKSAPFYGPNLIMEPMSIFYTSIPFQWCKNHLNQSYMWKLCLSQVDLPYWSPQCEWIPRQPPLLKCMGLATYFIF